MNATEKMTPELIEKITTKLFSIEQELALMRKWLEAGTDKDPVFLAQLQAMNETDGHDADYKVAYIASPVPELPNLDDVKPFTETGGTTAETASKDTLKGDLVQKFGLEQTGETPLMPEQRFEALCKYVILGHSNGMDVSKKWVDEMLIKQNLAITSTQESLLDELRKTRSAMMKKDMDLLGAQSLNWITENEKLAFAELAAKENLK